MIGDLWCDRCERVAENEYRQPDGSTVALCHEHLLDARWKAGNVNWTSKRKNESEVTR